MNQEKTDPMWCLENYGLAAETIDALDAQISVLERQLAEARAAYQRQSGVVMPDVTTMARALCKFHADLCGVDPDDQWTLYSDDFKRDVEVMLSAAPAAPKADDPVKHMLLEALEKVDSEHEILGWMKTCELRRGRGSFGIAVMSDELALDWQSHQKNLEGLIGLRRAAIAAARKEGGKESNDANA